MLGELLFLRLNADEQHRDMLQLYQIAVTDSR
jgi:hypothetical protein